MRVKCDLALDWLLNVDYLYRVWKVIFEKVKVIRDIDFRKHNFLLSMLSCWS